MIDSDKMSRLLKECCLSETRERQKKEGSITNPIYPREEIIATIFNY